MLIKLRTSLLRAAAARNLAVDLVKDHGAGALDIIDRALAIADKEACRGEAPSENEQILIASRVHVLGLIASLPER